MQIMTQLKTKRFALIPHEPTLQCARFVKFKGNLQNAF